MMHLVKKVIWVVTALGAIHVGVTALTAYDALAMLPVAAIKPVAGVIGACGLLSLLMCAYKCMGMEHCTSCHK
ncbi:MAG: hypothetical protein NT124_00405 [Candidatus Dependentiae bacterium]|nr:hypothetical protein [Candidatus Dependentiae bacterium]